MPRASRRRRIKRDAAARRYFRGLRARVRRAIKWLGGYGFRRDDSEKE